MSWAGTPSVMHTMRRCPHPQLRDRVGGKAHGTKTSDVLAPACPTASGDGVEDRDPLHVISALARRDAGYDVGAVGAVAQRGNEPSRPVMPWTTRRVPESRMIAITSAPSVQMRGTRPAVAYPIRQQLANLRCLVALAPRAGEPGLGTRSLRRTAPPPRRPAPPARATCATRPPHSYGRVGSRSCSACSPVSSR